MAFLIYLNYLIKEGVDLSMRKDITIEKIMLGGEKWNKTIIKYYPVLTHLNN